MKKLGLIFILSLVLSFPNFVLGADTLKIGYIDLQKALNTSDTGKEAQKILSEKAMKVQKSLEEKQERLKKMKDSIEKQGLILSEKARTGKEKEYQKELRDIERLYKDSQDEFKREEIEISQKIIDEMRKIVDKIGGEGNYAIILEKTRSGILYASDAVDLTDKVIKAHNEQRKQSK
ncbi:MAG: OmpH family outer membrane protein [Desulfobacterales bacterium]|nr:OmpH family outer membrane protein [Desulfobacterales bacterium]